FTYWDIYTSHRLEESEYAYADHFSSLSKKGQLRIQNELHLSVSIRSFRSERTSSFVKSILDLDLNRARQLYELIQAKYPIKVTRNIKCAKTWLRSKARGTESLGIIASSGAHRLKSSGIFVKAEIKPEIWFLNSNDDVRSSAFLEDVATEFEVQGLELDWTCVAWDANLRVNGTSWEFKEFRGTEWQNVNSEVRRRYLLNSYRVLLTRARQGMVIFIPEGDLGDRTSLPEFYDPVFNCLTSIGIEQL
ncbi:MAG: DNA/RNA helicase domain-containing protein, partial [Candidatus Promineifilaceae bacterium]|nr:DNA/RNA helicase domain-containing protein [Candidatus Promineifilaceae bacterium]